MELSTLVAAEVVVTKVQILRMVVLLELVVMVGAVMEAHGTQVHTQLLDRLIQVVAEAGAHV
jgi:hypothetical protein